MSEGERRRLWIPPELAYAQLPAPGEPDSQLVFDVHLISIHSPD